MTTPTMVDMQVTAEETIHTVQAELAERFGIAHSTIQLKCHTCQDVAHETQLAKRDKGAPKRPFDRMCSVERVDRKGVSARSPCLAYRRQRHLLQEGR